MKRLTLLIALFGVLAGAASGSFVNVISSNSSFSTTVAVPTAANCQQFGAAYYYTPSYPSVTICSGPLGYYSVTSASATNSFSVSGAIAAGSYSVYEYQMGSGYSGIVIAW